MSPTDSRMPRQRSSSLPRRLLVAGSPPRIELHSGNGSRQTIYSEIRTPGSNLIYSNKQRDLRNSFPLLLEESRAGETSETARHSSERQAVMSPATPRAGESECGYSCGPERSVPSMADFSESELDPQDSISNRGPSPSDYGRNWLFQPPPGWCNVHACYMSGEFFDPKYRAWMQVVRPRVRMIRAT